MSGFAITVPAAVGDEIRQHVGEQEPGFEAAGRLIVRTLDGRAVEYKRVRNGANVPERVMFSASWRPQPGHISILVHSHPSGGPAPSDLDLQWATNRRYRGSEHRALFAIFAADFLHVWRITDVATRSYERVPVVERRSSRRERVRAAA